MATEVVTRSRCELCGLADERAGAEGDIPPVLWSELVITKRLAGTGWANKSRRHMQLCLRCADSVNRAINGLLVVESKPNA